MSFTAVLDVDGFRLRSIVNIRWILNRSRLLFSRYPRLLPVGLAHQSTYGPLDSACLCQDAVCLCVSRWQTTNPR